MRRPVSVNATGIHPDVDTSNPSKTLRFKLQLMPKTEVFFKIYVPSIHS
jgi:hypothetical protein